MMKKLLNAIFAIALVLLPAIQVGAQSASRWPRTPVSVVYINETINEAPNIVEIFHNSHSEYFHSPGAPRFVLVDQQERWALGVGGFVQAKIGYDFDGIVDDIDFNPSSIERGNGPSTQYRMDATTSTLFLKLVGRSSLFGDFIIYSAGNWRGSDDTFQMLDAYIKTKHLTFGYTTGAFMDLAAAPPTVDYAGPCGMTFYRSTQFAFNYNSDWGLSMGMALETPDIDATENEYVSVGAQRFPDIPVYVKYNFAPNTHIRLAGIMRDISYRNLLTGRQHERIGWGAQASTLLTFGKLQLSGQYTIGEGIGSLMNDVSNVGMDIVPNPRSEGNMMMLLTDGWFASVLYNITPRLFASATYSQSNIRSRRGFAGANPEMYKRGQYLVANMFCNVSNNLQLGLEYLHGWRVDFNRDTYNANRINFSARYNF